MNFGEELAAPVDLVVLAVGRGPNNIAELAEKMKVRADRFLQEVRPQLRPVEMPVAGILLAGTARPPLRGEGQGARLRVSKG